MKHVVKFLDWNQEQTNEGLKDMIVGGALALTTLVPSKVDASFWTRNKTNQKVNSKINIRNGETKMFNMSDSDLLQVEEKLKEMGFVPKNNTSFSEGNLEEGHYIMTSCSKKQSKFLSMEERTNDYAKEALVNHKIKGFRIYEKGGWQVSIARVEYDQYSKEVEIEGLKSLLGTVQKWKK